MKTPPALTDAHAPARYPMGGEPLSADKARRMRWSATGLLAAMGLVFFTTHSLVGGHPAWGYVNAFAEAAMVGGLADWFAVTALFRHPLGLPIPHTAIIPRKKDRIADSMADFLRSNFLTPSVVARRMAGMNTARALGDFLQPKPSGEASANRQRITEGAAQLFAEILESLDPDRLGEQVKGGLAAQLHKVEVAPLLGKMLASAIEDERHTPILEAAIRWAGVTLEDNEAMVKETIHARGNAVLRWTGLDERLSTSVLDGLYKLLAEVLIDPDHPLRAKMEKALHELAHDLQHDDAMRARVEGMKREVLANPAMGEWWMGVWERLRRGLIVRARGSGAGASDDLRNVTADIGAALHRDKRLQLQINRFARRTMAGLATRYGSQIVTLVSETVKRWDAGTVTERIENAVGRDLQFIRINGTLVGGLVGASLHFITSFL